MIKGKWEWRGGISKEEYFRKFWKFKSQKLYVGWELKVQSIFRTLPLYEYKGVSIILDMEKIEFMDGRNIALPNLKSMSFKEDLLLSKESIRISVWLTGFMF